MYELDEAAFAHDPVQQKKIRQAKNAKKQRDQSLNRLVSCDGVIGWIIRTPHSGSSVKLGSPLV